MEKAGDLGTRPRLAALSLRIVARISAVAAIGIGAAVVVGWALGLPALKSIVRGAVEMKMNTAVGLVWSGCALLVVTDRRSAWMSVLLALAVGTLGMATLSQYVFGWDLSIDEFLINDTGNAYNAARGRMSPYTAASFMAVALGVVAVARSWNDALVWAAAAFVMGVGGVSLVGYLWNAREIVTDSVAPPVAIHTALALICLATGILATNSTNRAFGADAVSMTLSPIENRVLTGLVGGLLILFTAAGYVYRQGASTQDAADWLQHSRLVDQSLRDLYAASTDAQSAQRAYLLTRDMSYRDAYESRASDARSAAVTLKALVAGNATQATAFGNLERLLQNRLDTMSRVLALHEEGTPAQVREAINSARTLEVASAMKEAIADIDAAEAAHLESRRTELDRARRATLAALLAALAGTAYVASMLLKGVRREVAARRVTEQELEAAYAQSQEKHLELERSHSLLETQAKDILTANQFLDSVIENLPHTVFVKEAADLRYVRLNRAGYELLGTSLKDVRGMNDRDLFPKEIAEGFSENDREVLSSGRMKDIGREVIHTEDKGQRILHTRKIPILGEDEQPLYVLGISEDITDAEKKQHEILRLNEALERVAAEATSASRAKGTFLATMSHEIRTPMNGMLGMLELLSLTRLDADQKATLEVVHECSKSLLRIIDDILDFSKMEAGKLDIHPKPTDIRKLVQDMHSIYVGAASSKGLLVRHHVDPDISAALQVDPLRLRQILNNFTTNALKFTLRGSIDMAVRMIERDDGQETLEFSVTDTGIGISREDQKLLFEPFTQGTGDTANRFGGTGLGLSICRRLAEMMGGSVALESDLGKGTRISLTLRLPIANASDLVQATVDDATAQARPMATAATLSVEEAEAAGTLVLVVDDHPTNRMLISRQLLALGVASVSASDGVEALQVWSSRNLALIITDCHMPRMNGYELARNIRQQELNTPRRVPIIACTANALDEEAGNCLAAGMDDHLVKPVDLRALGGMLQQWLPRHSFEPQVPVPLAVSTGTQAPTAAIDLRRLTQTWGDSAEVTREILSTFRRVNEGDVKSLYQAIGSKDMVKVEEFAHRMLGAGKMVGADAFAIACEALGSAGKASNGQAVSAALAKFEAELRRLNDGLDDLLNAPAGS